MCVRCLAAQRSLDECSEGLRQIEPQALEGEPLALGGSIVTDEKSILYYLDGGQNFRWNAEQSLGSSVIVTYSFAESSELPSVFSNYDNPYDASSFSSFTDMQRQNFRLASSEFMAASGLVLLEVETGGDMSILNAHGTFVGGYADIPYVNGNHQSEVELVIDSSGDYNAGSYGYFTILHEIGHAVGLDHTHEGRYTLASHMDSTAETVMSYNYDHTAHGLQSLDHAALQTLYGDQVVSTGWSLSHNAQKSRLDADGSGGNDFFSVPVTVNEGAIATKVMGAAGNDVIEGHNAVDLLRGNQGDDSLSGNGGADRLRGGSGDDAIYGGAGNDFIHGGTGSDTIYGGGGNDVALGGALDDVLYGQDGNDELSGLLNHDTLDGGAGSDTLDGGRGNDLLTGGDGADVFIFRGDSAHDTITDFDGSQDVLRFVGTGLNFDDATLSTVDGHARIELSDVLIDLDGVFFDDLNVGHFDFV